MVLALAKILTLIINFKHKSIMTKEKELSSNDKRRRTTLRKKSIDELVNIVLRKDDVERKLQKSIETFKNLQDVNDKRIDNLKDSLAKSEEIQVAQEQTINNYSDVLEGINRCGFRNDYFNYSIIDDIVSQYVSGDITKEQFIKEVQSKTQIYLDE